jgi:hypothetical protein
MDWISNINFGFLKNPVFWSAISGMIALATFLNLKGRPFWHWRLQRLLNRERAFYERVPASSATWDNASEEGVASQYIGAVEEGISAIEALSDSERREAATKLLDLVGTLQTTHQSLVDSLESFSETDSREFLKNWDASQKKLQSIYYGGKIRSEAHTHCSKVESIVWELCSSGNATCTPTMARLRQLGSSVVVQDREVILPVMYSILDRCQREVTLISLVLREGDARRAIRLKEKYWFEVSNGYLRLLQSLKKMRTLGNEFSGLAAQKSRVLQQ